eukprot:21392_1
MGSIAGCCRTCRCPSEKDTAVGRRKLLNQSEWSKQMLLRSPSSTIKITTEYIEKPDGSLLFAKLFEPKDPSTAKAMMFYCLGFTDNTDFTCHEICADYAEMGFIVLVVDWKGHGRSDGILADIDDFDVDIVDEAIWAFAHATDKHIKTHNIYRKTIHAENNYFLNGASMGGAIAIKIALKSAHISVDYQWKGIVLFCPMVAMKDKMVPPPCVIWCLKTCCLPCCPRAKLIPNGVNPETLSRDAEIRKMLKTNPIRYDAPVSLMTAYNLLLATDTIAAHKHELEIPLFVGHGDDDQCTECECSKDLYHACGCEDEDKTIKIYQNKGHLLYSEDADVVEDSVEWMENIINKCTVDL